MRYIHSGDQVESDNKQDRSAQQKSPEQEEQPAAQSGRGQELEASAELGAVTRPIEGAGKPIWPGCCSV
ncbi:hypothetical protein ACFTAO_30380 [Paenibacillus rhizoplanae]